jgi:hypothetical protein
LGDLLGLASEHLGGDRIGVVGPRPITRQQLPEEWWYHVRVYDPHGYVRLLFVRYSEYVRKREE